MKQITVGLLWDTYTPAVEGQLTRDIIALQQEGQIMVVCKNSNPGRVLQALNVAIVDADTKFWIVYKTGEAHVEAPEGATTVIERDLYVGHTKTQLDTREHAGYFMKPQGRIVPSPFTVERPMPVHNGQTDPMVVLLWSKPQKAKQ